MPGAKKPTRDGPDIFPFRVLYSPTPGIKRDLSCRRRKTAGAKKPHGCRVRKTALVLSFLGSRARSLCDEDTRVNLPSAPVTKELTHYVI